jgi:outer membrane protein OmpA-like peptidoglycan-associated protein
MKKVITETNIKYNSNIEYKLSRNKIIFSGTIFDTKAKNNFISKVKRIFDDKELIYKIATLPLLDKRIYFDLRSSEVLEKYSALLDTVALSMLNNKNYRVEIAGYTDTIGSQSYNKKLSRKRVVNTQNELLLRGIDKKMLKLKAHATPPQDLLNEKSGEQMPLARCVIINWEKISEK